MVSQVVKFVFGTSRGGPPPFYVVQFATLLILYTGGNTSFNGFPFLASFVAGTPSCPPADPAGPSPGFLQRHPGAGRGGALLVLVFRAR